jgi:hypothetical protein
VPGAWGQQLEAPAAMKLLPGRVTADHGLCSSTTAPGHHDKVRYPEFSRRSAFVSVIPYLAGFPPSPRGWPGRRSGLLGVGNFCSASPGAADQAKSLS